MQAMSAGSLVAVGSLREFFRDAFHAASERQRLDIDEQAEQYVVNLLTMFSRADALYERAEALVPVMRNRSLAVKLSVRSTVSPASSRPTMMLAI